MTKLNFTLFVALVFTLLAELRGQDLDSVEYLRNYAERIKLDRIDDVYIPKDTEDALNELFRLTDPEGRKKLVTAPEDTIASKLHFSLGRWIQINWGFDAGSRLSHFYKLKGVTETDDKIDLLIRAFHRKLRGAPIDEEKLIQTYIEKRRKEHENRVKKLKVLDKNTRHKRQD